MKKRFRKKFAVGEFYRPWFAVIAQIEETADGDQANFVSRIIADLGGNVTSVYHERENKTTDVNGCYLRIALETRNFEHIAQIKQALRDAGFILLQ